GGGQYSKAPAWLRCRSPADPPLRLVVGGSKVRRPRAAEVGATVSCYAQRVQGGGGELAKSPRASGPPGPECLRRGGGRRSPLGRRPPPSRSRAVLGEPK